MSEKRSGRGRGVSRTPVFYPAFSLRVCMHIRSFSVSFDMCWYSHDVTMFPWLRLKSQRKEQRHPHVPSPHIVLCVLGCTCATLMHSMVPAHSIFDMNNVCWYVLVWKLIHCYVNLWLLFWTRQDREGFYVSSATMVIKTELCQYTEYRIWTQISRVHSPVV